MTRSTPARRPSPEALRDAAPDWLVEPLNSEGAARALGVSLRTLSDLLKSHPYYELRGRKRVFYPEHITRLRREIHECASKSNGSTAGRSYTGPDPMADASDNLSKLKTLDRQKKSGRR